MHFTNWRQLRQRELQPLWCIIDEATAQKVPISPTFDLIKNGAKKTPWQSDAAPCSKAVAKQQGSSPVATSEDAFRQPLALTDGIKMN